MVEPNGLYYMRARYYDPAVGRFISEDPLGFGGGDVNLYEYARNNPVTHIDPDGRLVLETLVGLGVVVDIALNIQYQVDSNGVPSVNIPPPSMFEHGFQFPFFIGVNMPVTVINIPFVGDIAVPTDLRFTIDPRVVPKPDKCK
jgi:RHS repeat-associated protein